MMPLQQGEPPGCDAPPLREPMRRLGGRRRAMTGATARGRPTPRPSGTWAPGCSGGLGVAMLSLLVLSLSDSSIAPYRRLLSRAFPLAEKACGSISPLERGQQHCLGRYL